MENIRKIGKYIYLLALLVLIFVFLVGLLFVRALESDLYLRQNPPTDFVIGE